MKFGFKIHLDDVAKKLMSEGFDSRSIDSEKLDLRVLEILQDEYDFFTSLGEEMDKIEDDSHPQPRNYDEYLEKSGEF